ncbi:MAG: deoxyribose-phosphate aldolase [candidate division Zixibacteria bacterium]|nr:deoxyribose-phosphate aldolase [candidate division Zixibacteria bacterium]
MQGQLSACDLASRIDHTNLSPDATASDIASLCAEAQEYGFAAVCVSPIRVADAVAAIRDGAVAICAVVGFPSGAHLSAIKAAEAAVCVREGAREIDMVANLGWLKDGQWDRYAEDLRLVRNTIGGATLLKVIIEASALDEADIVRAGIMAAQSGANYIKTSTGVYGQARLEDVSLLRRALPPDIKIKAAGGIRTVGQARAFIAAGADRIGASAGVGMMWERCGKPH